MFSVLTYPMRRKNTLNFGFTSSNGSRLPLPVPETKLEANS